MTLCSLIGCYNFYPEVGGRMLLWKLVGIYQTIRCHKTEHHNENIHWVIILNISWRFIMIHNWQVSFYSNIIRVIKSGKMRWAGWVARKDIWVILRVSSHKHSQIYAEMRDKLVKRPPWRIIRSGCIGPRIPNLDSRKRQINFRKTVPYISDGRWLRWCRGKSPPFAEPRSCSLYSVAIPLVLFFSIDKIILHPFITYTDSKL
jgi:hypothetical protein